MKPDLRKSLSWFDKVSGLLSPWKSTPETGTSTSTSIGTTSETPSETATEKGTTTETKINTEPESELELEPTLSRKITPSTAPSHKTNEKLPVSIKKQKRTETLHKGIYTITISFSHYYSYYARAPRFPIPSFCITFMFLTIIIHSPFVLSWEFILVVNRAKAESRRTYHQT